MIWSTSWVLIKIGLRDIPPLTFAGIRYFLAFVCLVPFVVISSDLRRGIGKITKKEWFVYSFLGLIYYAVAQGCQFLGLLYLPTLSVSLLLNFTPLVVTFFGIYILKEKPTGLQFFGMILNLAGVLIYFLPAVFPAGALLGIGFSLVSVFANSGGSLLSRYVLREAKAPVLLITLVSMGVGSSLLLACGLIFQGFPPLSLKNWAIIIWMAIVNTALAFTLWNYLLKTLSAMESSIINGLMLVMIAAFAWLMLGEGLSNRQLIGLVFTCTGVLVVQLRPQLVGKKDFRIRSAKEKAEDQQI